ncbi:hypothetical protein [Planococcus dechangensis]|uniref:Uncharacterized protein n=1 Tax=Planococcus dechangensis TaxID=1176255 RepID=A0ABV9MGJ1_9BACL
MKKSVRNTLGLMLLYGVIGAIIGFIVEGQFVLNLVLSFFLTGFLISVLILPRIEKRRIKEKQQAGKNL